MLNESLSIWFSLYFVTPFCGVFSALLRDWDIDGWDGRDHCAKIQLVSSLLAHIALSGHLGVAGCNFPLCCGSPRTSPCLGRNPLIRLACRWLCSSASCWLCSSRFFSSSPLLDDERCSASAPSVSTSLSPTLRVELFDVLLAFLVPVLLYFIFFSPLAPWLWFLFRFSHHCLWLSLILSRDTLW